MAIGETERSLMRGALKEGIGALAKLVPGPPIVTNSAVQGKLLEVLCGALGLSEKTVSQTEKFQKMLDETEARLQAELKLEVIKLDSIMEKLSAMEAQKQVDSVENMLSPSFVNSLYLGICELKEKQKAPDYDEEKEIRGMVISMEKKANGVAFTDQVDRLSNLLCKATSGPRSDLFNSYQERVKQIGNYDWVRETYEEQRDFENFWFSIYYKASMVAHIYLELKAAYAEDRSGYSFTKGVIRGQRENLHKADQRVEKMMQSCAAAYLGDDVNQLCGYVSYAGEKLAIAEQIFLTGTRTTAANTIRQEQVAISGPPMRGRPSAVRMLPCQDYVAEDIVSDLSEAELQQIAKVQGKRGENLSLRDFFARGGIRLSERYLVLNTPAGGQQKMPSRTSSQRGVNGVNRPVNLCWFKMVDVTQAPANGSYAVEEKLVGFSSYCPATKHLTGEKIFQENVTVLRKKS